MNDFHALRSTASARLAAAGSELLKYPHLRIGLVHEQLRSQYLRLMRTNLIDERGE